MLGYSGGSNNALDNAENLSEHIMKHLKAQGGEKLTPSRSFFVKNVGQWGNQNTTASNLCIRKQLMSYKDMKM